MKLKRIKASGFKSFADNLDMEIGDGITGIVGPNGSGKSNIVDAVKWVLGEQSIKALRGTNNMTDVIFVGSKTREAKARASVALTFDNSDRYLNSDFDDIEIKRVLYKTGENDFFINNVKVRLKDIITLFLDSGSSKESFNIISQGNVKDIVNSKPTERRGIFESAAGVQKYKKRKEASVRKLDKTNDNLERIRLLIDELELQVKPLEEQSKKAKRYKEIEEQLKTKEISLIAHDISNLNTEYETCKEKIDYINDEIIRLNALNNSDTSEIEKLKLQNLKVNEEINNLNAEYKKLTKELNDLNSEKQITIERQKYQVDDIKLQNNIVALKEKELSLNNEIKIINDEIEENKKKFETVKEEESKILSELLLNKEKIESLRDTIDKLNFDVNILLNRINILENNIENDLKLPKAVKQVLNYNIEGVHNTIGNLIKVDEEYNLAIDTALGYSSNFIIVDDQVIATTAIERLRKDKVGRATFLPLNIIKERLVDSNTLNIIKSVDGFIDIASSLVEYNSKFTNIITNQLGNVVVVNNIDTANVVGKRINYRYRIVTLNGEIIHTGGSITGGINTFNNSSLKDRVELEKCKTNLTKQEQLKDIKTTELNDLIKEYSLLNESNERIRMNLLSIKEIILHKENNHLELKENYNKIKDEILGTKDVINQTIDQSLNNLLNEVSEKELELTNAEKKLNAVTNIKDEINTKIEELDHVYRKSNSEFNKHQNELKSLEIKSTRAEVKLDTLLNVLNDEYQMTYEKALANYELDDIEDNVRVEVNALKKEIKLLGEVNLGSISEFERVNTRYTFLVTQKDDLEASIENLNSIIDEMDEIMIEKFKTTFKKIQIEYSKVFNEIFKGGRGILELTDPDDILNTGIDIIAEPPGKKINYIGLLSGGEKTLTALALLFAILNVKTIPFCILDEVEESLDETNVDIFGKYLQNKKNQSQFIIITHKKRTMEYVDMLYGITMQESGVSKLVSVKLEDIKS